MESGTEGLLGAYSSVLAFLKLILVTESTTKIVAVLCINSVSASVDHLHRKFRMLLA